MLNVSRLILVVKQGDEVNTRSGIFFPPSLFLYNIYVVHGGMQHTVFGIPCGNMTS